MNVVIFDFLSIIDMVAIEVQLLLLTLHGTRRIVSVTDRTWHSVQVQADTEKDKPENET